MLSFYPKNDARQTLRIRRFFMAAGSYLMWAVLIAFCAATGHYRLSLLQTIQWLCIGTLCINAFLYGIFRMGWNKKFKDPSLTMVQMTLATLAVMITLYFADPDTRGVLLLIYPVLFVFGFFRLHTFQFFSLAVMAALGYGVVVCLLALLDPSQASIHLEVLRLIILATVLAWFSIVGAYVNRLRREVIRANGELKKALAYIEEMAIRDPLTGAFNRRKLMEILNLEKARANRFGEPFSLCLFDLDHFKRVNDTFGHLKGDEVLKVFSSEIQKTLRNVDYFARYGGEEFVVVLARTDRDGAYAYAQRAREFVSHIRFPDMPQNFRITISGGVTTYYTGRTMENLLAQADTAMYKAKANGRNRVEQEPPLPETPPVQPLKT